MLYALAPPDRRAWLRQLGKPAPPPTHHDHRGAVPAVRRFRAVFPRPPPPTTRERSLHWLTSGSACGAAMTSYGSVPIDYSLNQRRLPRSQVERIPTVDDWEDDDGSGRDDVDGADGEHEVGSLASSLRANFLPPSARLLSATDPAFERYKSIGSPSPGSSFLSPVFSHLPSVKPSRLTVSSDDAQRLRRKLLRGANLLVVQGGYSGKRFIYERLKELGVAVTIMDGPDTVWRAAAEEGLIAEFIEIDFTEHDTVFQRAMDILLSLELTFDGVTTFYEEAGTYCGVWEGGWRRALGLARVGWPRAGCWFWCCSAVCPGDARETALVGIPLGASLLGGIAGTVR